MRLLLDESVPRRLRLSLRSHQVRTVVEMGWSGVTNGSLLKRAALNFDALITTDKNLPKQQNLANLPVSVVVLDVRSNQLAAIIPLIPAIERALTSLSARTCVIVSDS